MYVVGEPTADDVRRPGKQHVLMAAIHVDDVDVSGNIGSPSFWSGGLGVSNAHILIDAIPMNASAGNQPPVRWVRNQSQAGPLDWSKPATYASKCPPGSNTNRFGSCACS